MAGIYIHIPFCKQACNYCDFHFSTSLKNKDGFLIALKNEIELQKDYLSNETISTIYFGGGTPSLLSEAELMSVFEMLHREFVIAPTAEITLEANPDDITKEKINELKHTPVNRLSIGIQSFFDEDLKLMNRAHTSKEAETAVKLSQDKGFENITIDLIYGIPTLTNQNWKHNLNTTFDLEVKHISAYCLTVEPKTALAHQIKTGKISNVDEQQSSEHFEMMLEEMNKHGFTQYEISNFCKPGFHSKHNSSYWLKENYLGLGPSAHSFNGTSRQWNISNNPLYIQALLKGEMNYEKEELTSNQRYNEYVLTSLRTMWGSDLGYVETQFGIPYLTHCMAEARPYLESKKLLLKENKLFLSDQGKLFADKIASDLFLTQ
ncbi:MAG: radical SAM family heme chaperone HemW [Bacteroidota bacterium]